MVLLPHIRKVARPLALAVAIAVLLAVAGCDRIQRQQAEYAYVAVPQVFLRDRVAAVYSKVGMLHNGERVQVLERSRRFVRVRGDAGDEGWVEQRYLVGADVFNQFQKLASDNARTPVQATGLTRAELNLHVTPGRDTDHLYQLKDGDHVDILKRATAEKPTPKAFIPPAAVVENTKAIKGKKAEEEAPKPNLEDWYLVRDSQRHVGWALARMIDIDVPLDVAQYAEGQRIVAAFILDRVQDGDKQVPQYLMVLTEPKDGLPFDFNQIRVFTWNVKRHRYETAYRERNLYGVFPVTVAKENFDKEGELPTFTLRVQDDSGNVTERKYKLNTPIVRRVLAPGEQPPKPVRTAARRRRR